jgi:pimeloyl-ACP methyl ester carboxylesterase
VPSETRATTTARELAFTASDGVRIAATLHEAPRADAPLVILVHQLGSTRAEWDPLERRLHAPPAIATLALDLRGHGASTRATDGRTLDFRTFDRDEWAATALDVLAAVAFVRSADSPIRPSRIAVVGSSIGSTAAIAAAAREPGLDPIVALSPGRAYHGFDAIAPALTLGRRTLLAVAAEGEPDSVETARAMARITGTDAIIVPGNAHGVRLFDGDPTLLDRVERFLRQALGSPRSSGRP